MSIEDMFEHALAEINAGNLFAADSYVKEIASHQLSNAQMAKLATLRTSLQRSSRTGNAHWSQYLSGAF